jgi:hypothetical protein
MAISLKNLLLIAEETGVNPDGSNFDQRSLGYGDNEPLVIKDLPAVEKETNGALGLVGEVTDNFVRGGAVALGISVVDDLKRLGKLLIRPNGLAWAGAQVALAATNPKGPILPSTGGSANEAQGLIGDIVNTVKENLPPRNRLTLPLSILATAGTGAAGVRFRKDGLIDTEFESGFNYDPLRGGPKYESTLLGYATTDTENSSEFTLYGKYTNIYNGGFEGREDLILRYPAGPHSTFGIGDTEIKRYKADPYRGHLPLFNTNLFELRQGPNSTKANSGIPADGYVDYRNKTNRRQEVKQTKIGLYKLGDPGIKMEPTEEDSYNVYNVSTVDKISAANIFKRENFADYSNEFEDYIKFRIAVVDTENPLNDNVMIFRAYLDSLSDDYSGDWSSHKYNGRAENFYTYSGFDRKISFSFKIHTQTRWEQKPLWRKLNYLVSQTAPEYKNRRMRGVFSRLTIGDWMNEVPGFFTSVGLSWATAYPWETRYDKDGADRDLNEYPHILDVQCAFTPVHNFAPSNSPTTPFILPEIGVSDNRKYARPSSDEDSDEFNSNGIAADAEIADIDIINVPPPPVPEPALDPLSPPTNDIIPIEERGLLT